MSRRAYFEDCSYFRGKTSGYKLGYGVYDSRWRWLPLVKEVKSLRKTGRLLDVGCAWGFFLKFLSGFEKHGVEISALAVALARKNNPDSTIVQGDFADTKFKGQFDIISAFEVLEHMPNIDKTIGKIHAMLSPKGYLVASFPVMESSLERRWFGLFDRTHVNPSGKIICAIKRKFKIMERKFIFDGFRFALVTRFRIAPVHQSYLVIAQKR